MNITIDMVKRMKGEFSSVNASWYDKHEAWLVTFWTDEERSYTLEAQRGEVRRFKTLDAVVSALKALGFGNVQVSF
jgi:hypothetical protein